MDQENFKNLFLKNVGDAVQQARKRNYTAKAYEKIEIELHGCGVSGQLLSLEDAADRLYISKTKFYRVVDIGIKSVTDDHFTVFVKVSAHQPTEFEKTWNTPPGNGPFKIVEPLTLR